MNPKKPTIPTKKTKVERAPISPAEALLDAKSKRKKPVGQMMEETVMALPRQFNALNKEMKSMTHELSHLNQKQGKNNISNERIYDRLESLLLEQRTTNVLLSKLVAIGISGSVMDLDIQDVESRAEQERIDAYTRIGNGD